MQPRACGKAKQVDAACNDILSHLARRHCKTRIGQFIVQFGMDQMHLPQIGLARIARDTGAMLHAHALMRITRDAKPGEKFDLVANRL
jgi:hypothetical protein